MKIFKDKKTKDIIFICMTLISLLEWYFAYKIANKYAGIYNIGIFILFLGQPIYYKALFKNQNAYLKLKIIAMGLILFISPLIIYYTLPKYTYNEGKQIVQRYVHSSRNTVFIDISKEKDTVPLVNNPEQLFVSNRAYYYEIKSTIGNKYFMVNPLTGKVVQMPKDYWTGDEK
ncbi:hypothetical protein [Clostridium tagluense]|uniref:Uncharacterized protein n=1 Tax=Clostridium tagluense TaxID=360422 RepID=A0A401UNF2_9CLOT|nr:hypothetical protein [Clostridium tagluense]GCD11059.1 hypothetical protein Ctaglu_26820 [Clostridium tagluense]